jgi:hypothetical protein
MARIAIGKKESVAETVERVITQSDDEVLLVVPRGAELTTTADHFALLKREAAAAGKTIAVESVDDAVLALAEEADIPVVHPFFRDVNVRSLTDIVPVASSSVPKRMKGARRLPVEAVEVAPLRDIAQAPALNLASEAGETIARPSGKRWRRIVTIGTVLLLLGGGAWAYGAWWGSATVSLEFQKDPWQYAGTIQARTSVDAPSGTSIPAELFTVSRNTTQLYLASGKANVSTKAKGTITIWNAYSSASQSLVQNTRFKTPDGKIFRLDQNITVPGATVKDGKIIPSSITASVTADQPGGAYNVGPIEKLVIPGFEKTPKYDGFYGSLGAKLAGGAVGERAVPTDADIADGKKKTEALLREGLVQSLAGGDGSHFTIPELAREFTVIRMTVSTTTDDDGNFTIFGEMRLRALGYPTGAVDGALQDLGTSGDQRLFVSDLQVSYAPLVADFDKGVLQLPVTASGTVTTRLDIPALQSSLQGRSVAEAKNILIGLYRFVSGQVIFHPRYLLRIPGEPSRIHVEVR